MVKAKIVISLLAAAFLLSAGGCEKSMAPMHPLEGPALNLTVPQTFDPGSVSGKFTLIVTFKYRAVSGADVVSGTLDYNQIQSLNGPIRIPLPHGGKWLVSAEWINFGTGAPLSIGADVVDVQGLTGFALEMGNLNSACYQGLMAENGSISYNPDFLGFDNHSLILGGAGPSGDMQCLLNVVPPSLYFQPSFGPAPKFTYLGNGDWVNFTVVPLDAVFVNNTLAAKRAVEGAAAVMADNDVYAMKLSATTTAWFQVNGVSNTGTTTVNVYYRLNRHSYHYMKFDVTAYGDINCNSSGVTLY